MQKMSSRRCPYCGLVVERSGGAPVLPGMLIVCMGCAGPSRFADDHSRLIPLGPGELGEEVRAAVHAEQAKVRESFDRYGRPPGYAWRTVALCGPCWDGIEPERVPVTMRGVPSSPCAFCGNPTTSGIYRRMLRPLEA